MLYLREQVESEHSGLVHLNMVTTKKLVSGWLG